MGTYNPSSNILSGTFKQRAGRMLGTGGTREEAMEATQVNMAKLAQARAQQQGQIEREQWELKKKMAEQSGQLANQFLTQWMGGVKEIGSILKGGVVSGEAGGMGGVLGMMGDISKKIGEEYESYKSTYGGAEQEFIGAAREEAGARRETVQQLRGLADPDYEGVEGRAAADVAGQSEMARESMQREMMSMGVDPSSGRFGALTRRSFIDEAKNRAISMNVARRGEKERVTGTNLAMLSQLDPSKTAKVGLGIREQGTKMLGQRAEIAKGIGDVAGQYTKNVLEPYAQMAGHFMGQSGGMGLQTNINL